LGLAFLAIVLSPCVEGFEIRPYDMTHGAMRLKRTQGIDSECGAELS